MSWLKAVKQNHDQHNDYVIITVVETKGSTPCNNGDKLIYSGDDKFYGSIGGGNFEFKALQYAQKLLTQEHNEIKVVRYPLGASLGQCCGGYVKVMFESYLDISSEVGEQSWFKSSLHFNENKSDYIVATVISNGTGGDLGGYKFVYSQDQTSDTDIDNLNDNILKEVVNKYFQTYMFYDSIGSTILSDEGDICYERFTYSELQPVAVFGAGHISKALMPILSKLPIKIYWVDDRVSQFDQYSGDTSEINIICDEPSSVVLDLPKNIYCIVITYSHQLDFDICEQVLARDSYCYLGVIGSTIKGNKFRKRLLNKGFSEQTVGKLSCPIGVKHKLLKSPIAIAVSIASEMINFLESKSQTGSACSTN